MHFVTEADWELQDPLIKALQGAAGSRLYPCVEVNSNQPIWHLDLHFDVDQMDAGYWRRFVVASVEQVTATLDGHRPGKCRLHLQSARTRCPSARYEIWPVQSLKTGQDRKGRVVHLVELPHGNFAFPDRTVRESDVKALRLVYQVDSI